MSRSRPSSRQPWRYRFYLRGKQLHYADMYGMSLSAVERFILQLWRAIFL